MEATQGQGGQLRSVLVIALFALAYFAAIYLAASVRFGEDKISAFWPPAGVLIAVLVCTRLRLWPAILIATITADMTADTLFSDRSWVPGFFFGVGNAASGLLGAVLLRRVAHIRSDLARLRDFLAVVGLAAIVSPIPSAFIGTYTALTLLRDADFWPAWFTWWLGDAIGLLIVAPAMLTWIGSWQRDTFIPERSRILESGVLTVVTVVVVWFVFSTDYALGANALVYLSLVVPCFLWAAIRFDPRAVTTLSFFTALVIVWTASRNTGPFVLTGGSAEQVVLGVQAVLCMVAIATAVVSSAMTERRLVMADLQTEMAEKQQALEQLKQNKETLADQERKLAVAVDAAQMGMWDLDVATGDALWTDAVYEMLGAKREGATPSFENFLSHVHPEDREMLESKLKSVMVEGDSVEMEFRSAGGDNRWIQAYGRVTRAADGAAAQITGVCFDVTAEKSLREHLRQTQKLQAVGTLAGGIAHDFNNVLTGIVGFAELGIYESSDEEAKKSFNRILGLTERAAALTRQLLAFSRQQSLERQVIDLNQLVAGTEAMLISLIGENVRLEVEPGRQATVQADRNQLEQVLVNLVINARDALPASGGCIHISLAHKSQAADDGTEAGAYACLSVRDNGQGMAPETIDRAFEPFFTTKRIGKGTGLGLAMVYGIIEQHGGFVTVDSQLGEGTTFHVFLPVVVGEVVPQPSPQGLLQEGGGARILLVEDEESVRTTVKSQLERLGYEVVVAENLAAAEQIHKTTGEVDLLLTDIVMPDGSGIELLARLKRHQPGLKCLFMSGYSEDMSDISEMGENFLPKPFRLEDLATALQSSLGWS